MFHDKVDATSVSYRITGRDGTPDIQSSPKQKPLSSVRGGAITYPNLCDQTVPPRIRIGVKLVMQLVVCRNSTLTINREVVHENTGLVQCNFMIMIHRKTERLHLRGEVQRSVKLFLVFFNTLGHTDINFEHKFSRFALLVKANDLSLQVNTCKARVIGKSVFVTGFFAYQSMSRRMMVQQLTHKTKHIYKS